MRSLCDNCQRVCCQVNCTLRRTRRQDNNNNNNTKLTQNWVRKCYKTTQQISSEKNYSTFENRLEGSEALTKWLQKLSLWSTCIYSNSHSGYESIGLAYVATINRKLFHFGPPAKWKLSSIFALSSELHSKKRRAAADRRANLSIYAYLCLYVGHVQTRSHQLRHQSQHRNNHRHHHLL